jgi:hypothetical protein
MTTENFFPQPDRSGAVLFLITNFININDRQVKRQETLTTRLGQLTKVLLVIRICHHVSSEHRPGHRDRAFGRNKWRRILRIVWRAARTALPFAGRVRQTTDERSLSKCPAILISGAKPDGLIVGRESGPAARHISGAGQAGRLRHIAFKKCGHLIFKMTGM